MAEIILPPEENEETPQTPELNIDKPTTNSKVITIEFEAKKTNKVSTKDTNQQLYTTDTDAWFEFKETSLEGANGTYSVVFRNRHDGSIFQRTGDVVNGVAYYKIPHQEIRHAGAWRGQIVYTLSNGDTTSREFGYDVKGHILDGKDVREIVVEDFETLMSQLRSMKDNAGLELADLVSTTQQNELERQQFFDGLVEDIDELQANYQELLDTGVLQTNINNKLEQLEEEYAPKLTEVTAQLAQKSDTSFVVSEIAKVADGAPKGSYPTLEALQTAFPQGDSGNYVVSGRIHTWNGTTWTDTGIVYQATAIQRYGVEVGHLSPNIQKAAGLSDASTLPWEYGRFGVGNQFENTGFHNQRITSMQPIYLEGGSRIISDAYDFVIIRSDVNGANIDFPYGDAWNTGAFSVTIGAYYRFTLRKKDNTVITTTEKQSLPSGLMFENPFNIAKIKDGGLPIAKLSKEIKSAMGLTTGVDLTWLYGRFGVGNQFENTSFHNQRITSVEPVHLTVGSEITVGSMTDLSVIQCDEAGNVIGYPNGSGWLTTPLTLTGEGYYRFTLRKKDNTAITNDDRGTMVSALRIFEPAVSSTANNVRELDYNDFVTVSDYRNEKMSHGTLMEIDESGNVYLAYLGGANTTETPEDTTIKPKLAVFNLANPRDVEYHIVAEANQTIGTYTIDNRPPYEPNVLLKDGIVYYYMNLSVGGVLSYFVREFNPATKQFGELRILKLNDGETNHDFTLGNVQSVYNARKGTSVTLTDFMLTSKIEFDGTNYYAYITAYGAGYNGMLLRSTDGINWDVVGIPDFGANQISEAQVLPDEDKIYMVARSNANGIYKCVYTISTNTFGTPIHIPTSIASRPQIFRVNGVNYIMYNVNDPLTTDWGTLERNKAVISEIDSAMSEKIVKYIYSEGGFHYYAVADYKGSLYMGFSTDVRKLNIWQIRSNIGFMALEI